jgi:transcriptional regulator with XRE-family HTH domain
MLRACADLLYGPRRHLEADCMGHEMNVISAKRRELGLSQEQLANRAGVSRSSVQRAEEGWLSPETLSSIARVLKVCADELTSALGIKYRLRRLQSLLRKRNLKRRELTGLPADLRRGFEEYQKARTDLVLKALDLFGGLQRWHLLEEECRKWRECAAADHANSSDVTRVNLRRATEALRKIPKPMECFALPAFLEANLRWIAAQTLLELVSAKYSNSEPNEGALQLKRPPSNPMRILRERRGWSQDGMAQIAKTGKATIQRLENGENVAPETLCRILAGLGVKPGEFVEVHRIFQQEIEAHLQEIKAHRRGLGILRQEIDTNPETTRGIGAVVVSECRELVERRTVLEDGMVRYREAQDGLAAEYDERSAAMSHFLACVRAALDSPNEDTSSALVQAKEALPSDDLDAHVREADAAGERFFESMRRYAKAVARIEYALTGNVSLIRFESSSAGKSAAHTL